jgi:hypothetical protein
MHLSEDWFIDQSFDRKMPKGERNASYGALYAVAGVCAISGAGRNVRGVRRAPGLAETPWIAREIGPHRAVLGGQKVGRGRTVSRVLYR